MLTSSVQGPLVPTWLTLKKLPCQFACVAKDIASNLGKVLAADEKNNIFSEPRFCVALDTINGWETELEIED